MSETPGGPESLKLMELPSRPLGKGEVRVAVRAAGVNFPDTLIIADKYQFKPPRPFAPGHEIAGDITEVGEGVTGYKTGDRVIGMIGHGGYATEAVVDQGQLLPMPANMSYEDGSAFTMTYGTSYYALKQRSDYKPGETVREHGVTILGPLDIAATLPTHASQMYARNLYELIVHLAKDAKLNVDFADEITRGCCLTYDGRAAAELATTGKDA